MVIVYGGSNDDARVKGCFDGDAYLYDRIGCITYARNYIWWRKFDRHTGFQLWIGSLNETKWIKPVYMVYIVTRSLVSLKELHNSLGCSGLHSQVSKRAQ